MASLVALIHFHAQRLVPSSRRPMQSVQFLFTDDTSTPLLRYHADADVEFYVAIPVSAKVLPRVLVDRFPNNRSSFPKATHTKFQVDRTRQKEIRSW